MIVEFYEFLLLPNCPNSVEKMVRNFICCFIGIDVLN